METMNDYTISCTAEQTKRVLALGASIEVKTETVGNPNIGFGFNRNTYIIPTAEQMIGWLEKQGILVLIDPSQDKFYGSYSLRRDDGYWSNRIFLDGLYPSRKEATLAAINAALDYLVNNNLIK